MTAPTNDQLEASALVLEHEADVLRSFKTVAVPDPGTTPTTPTSNKLGDLPNFMLNHVEYFDTDFDEGQISTAMKGRLACYPSNYLDTQGQKGSGSHYDPNNISAKDGFCRIHTRMGKVLNNVVINGKTTARKGDPCGTGGAIQLVDANGKIQSQLYGRWEVRRRSDEVSGYKEASMLWPISYNWQDGEIDWIEGSLNGNMQGFNHVPGNPSQNDPASGIPFNVKSTDWHVYAVEWTPGIVKFFVDGKLVGSSTKAPTKAMFYNGQIEANIGGTQPTAQDDGYVYIDYVAQWAYTGK